MYTDVVSISDMLQLCLWHDLYNIVFKIKYKLHMASGSSACLPPTPH